MELQLDNFRCHSSYHLSAGSGINLLSGSSGVGKSTVLQAIYWAIYGNLRAVAPLTAGAKERTRVTLSFGPLANPRYSHLLIQRWTKPGLLTVQQGDNQLTSQAAQEWLNYLFGDKELFLAHSYMPQGHHSLLLDGRNQDMMHVLNSLAFCQGAQPAEHIERIGRYSQSIQQQLYLARHEHDQQQDLCSTMREPDPVACIDSKQASAYQAEEAKVAVELSRLSAASIVQREKLSRLDNLRGRADRLQQQLAGYDQLPDNLEQRLTECRQELLSLNTRLTRHQQYQQIKQGLLARLAANKQQLASQLQLGSPGELTAKADLIEQWEQYQQLLTVCRRLEPRVAHLLPMASPVDQQQVWLTQQQEEQRAQQQQIANSMGILYQPELLSLLPHLPDIMRWKRRQQLERQLAELSGEDITEQQYQDALLSSRLLTCPSCQVSLSQQDGQLLLGDRPAISSQQLADISSARQRTVNRERLKQQLAELLCGPKPPEVPAEWLPMLTAIERPIPCRYIPSPANSSTELQLLLEYQQAVEKLGNAPKQPKPADCSLAPSRLRSLAQQSMEDEKRRERLLSEFSLLNEQLATLAEPELAEQDSIRQQQLAKEEEWLAAQLARSNQQQQLLACYQQLNDEINSIQIDTTLDERYHQLQQHHDELVTFNTEVKYSQKVSNSRRKLANKRKQVEQWEKELTEAYQIQQLAIQHECELLEAVVANINYRLDRVIKALFDVELTARLKLHKQLKTVDRVKQVVNMELYCRGAACDLSNLSGGEKDRLSLAIMLAVRSLVGNPLLLLDESWSSLDGPTKDRCVEVVRQYVGDEVTLCVSHDTTLGIYGRVEQLQ